MTDELPEPILTAMTFDEDLEQVPDPNGHPNMTGEVLPDDWTPDGDR